MELPPTSKKIVLRQLLVFVLLSSSFPDLVMSYPKRSSYYYSNSELSSQLDPISFDGKPVNLVRTSNEHIYFGTINGLYRASWSSPSDRQPQLQLVAAVGSKSKPVLVTYLYMLGLPQPLTAFICSTTVPTGGSEGMSAGCTAFNISSRPGGDGGQDQLPWQLASVQPSSRVMFDILMPRSPRDARRVSLPLTDAHAFISVHPNVLDTLDIIALRWPAFDRIVWSTADPVGRLNRELWISRSARPVAMATRGDRLYALFTEDAFEASNYYGSVSGEAYRSAGAVIKLPRFTRLARLCLNDPGSQSASRDTRVMTSFFKLRLICRSGDVDYDVLELATEPTGENGTIYGIFSLQNSPPGLGGFQALCRFSLAEAEAVITAPDGDFIQLRQDSLHAPYFAQRLTRAEFARGNGGQRAQPTSCRWTSEEASRLRLSSLQVERSAPLLARPLVAGSIAILSPSVHRFTALTRLSKEPTAGGDVLLLGTAGGAVLKLVAPPAESSDTTRTPSAVAIETLQLFSSGNESQPPAPVDSLAVLSGRLIAVSSARGLAVALPAAARCSGQRVVGCEQCAALKDPRCVWSVGVKGGGAAGADGGGVCAPRTGAEAGSTAVEGSPSLPAAVAVTNIQCDSAHDHGQYNQSRDNHGPYRDTTTTRGNSSAWNLTPTLLTPALCLAVTAAEH